MRSDQVNRLSKLHTDQLFADEMDEHSGGTSHRRQADVLMNAAERNSTAAEIQAAQPRMF